MRLRLPGTGLLYVKFVDYLMTVVGLPMKRGARYPFCLFGYRLLDRQLLPVSNHRNLYKQSFTDTGRFSLAFQWTVGYRPEERSEKCHMTAQRAGLPAASTGSDRAMAKLRCATPAGYGCGRANMACGSVYGDRSNVVRTE